MAAKRLVAPRQRRNNASDVPHDLTSTAAEGQADVELWRLVAGCASPERECCRLHRLRAAC